MSMTGNQAYALSKKYTKETVEGAGALKGKDAYEIAVDEGFVGTREEWLASLKATGVAYIYEQTIPSARWEITHSLKNQFPVVVCIDDDGDEIIGDVKFQTMNMLTIIFSQPVTGKAYIK